MCLDVKITPHEKDIIQKHTSSLFKDATLEFYGLKTAKIKELLNVELPVIEVGGSSSDFIFLLEDNSLLHFEFESSYNRHSYIRFAHYDLRLYERYEREVNTVIIYTADVKDAPSELKIGSLSYHPDKIMMGQYDGNSIFEELDAKIKSGSALTDTDMLKLIFLPLMRHTLPRYDLAVNSIKLAQTIPDATKRDACIAAAFAFANKYVEKSRINELLEVLRMTELATMLVEDVRKETREETMMEVAKKMLRRGMSIEAIMEDTGLDDSTIRQLQMEFNQK
jgi:predicted transposase YdaD